MVRRYLTFALGSSLFLLLSPVAGSAPRDRAATEAGPVHMPAPETGVPQSHWCYDALTHLMRQRNLTGYPDNTFSGKFVLTRRTFAEAAWNALCQAEQLGEVGLNSHTLRSCKIVKKLVREFEPELIQLTSENRLKARLVAIDTLCRDPRPRGVSIPRPYADVSWGFRPTELEEHLEARNEGERLAAEAWMRGDHTLLSSDPLPERFPELSVMLPVRYVPGASESPQRWQTITGYNREIWRRLREDPLPQRSRLGWVREVFDLKRTWQRKQDIVRVKRSNGSLFSRDGQFEFSFPTVVRVITCFQGEYVPIGRKNSDQPFHRPLTIDGERNIRLAEGPAGSGVVLIRSEHPIGGKRWQTRIRAVDLRTGWVLNVVAD